MVWLRSSQQQVVHVKCECYSLRCVSPQARVQHVRGEATSPWDILLMVLRVVAGILCFRLPLGWWPCTHHVTVLHVCVEEGGLHVCRERCSRRS